MNIDAWYESRLEINERLAEFDIDIWEEKNSLARETATECAEDYKEHQVALHNGDGLYHD